MVELVLNRPRQVVVCTRFAKKVFKTINKLPVGCLAALFVLYWLLNELNMARRNHTCIELALSPQACLILYSIAGCFQAMIYYNDLRKRPYESRLCIRYSASWLS